jgi:hypothetical protein
VQERPSLAIPLALLDHQRLGATFETMTTRKSFSLILRESTFAVSLKIFPVSSALSAYNEIGRDEAYQSR